MQKPTVQQTKYISTKKATNSEYNSILERKRKEIF